MARLSLARDNGQEAVQPAGNPYEFVKLLGSGTFGKVYTARRIRDDKLFACKEITVLPQSKIQVKDIVAEINTLRTLKHPNIVRYIDRYHDPKQKYVPLLLFFVSRSFLL